MMKRPDITRRALMQRAFAGVTCATTPLLQGCGNTPDESEALSIIKQGLGFGPDRQFTDTDVKRIDYASIGVRFEPNPMALVALAEYQPDHRLEWISAEHRMLITRRGRLMRFIGHGIDYKVEIDAGEDPLFRGLTAQSGPVSAQWALSYPERQIIDLAARAELRSMKRQKYQGVFEELTVTRWIESVTVKQARWSYENEYLITDDGRIVQSRQYLAPDLPRLEIVVMRPAAGA